MYDDARLFFQRGAGDDVDLLAQFFKLAPFASVRFQGDIAGNVLQLVAADAQFRETRSAPAVADGPGNLGGMEFQVFFDVCPGRG